MKSHGCDFKIPRLHNSGKESYVYEYVYQSKRKMQLTTEHVFIIS